MRGIASLLVFTVMAIGLVLSAASGGGIWTGANCCACLSQDDCLTSSDTDECSNQVAEQINGNQEKVTVTEERCLSACNDCSEFELEVQNSEG